MSCLFVRIVINRLFQTTFTVASCGLLSHLVELPPPLATPSRPMGDASNLLPNVWPHERTRLFLL